MKSNQSVQGTLVPQTPDQVSIYLRQKYSVLLSPQHYMKTRINSLDSDEDALANVKSPLKLDAVVSKP